MKFFLVIATMIFSTAITSAYAEKKQHSHGGRVHSHPLPSKGIKHSHNGGAIGVSQKAEVDVFALQRKLKSLGYYAGPINGQVTEETRIALRKHMNREKNKSNNSIGSYHSDCNGVSKRVENLFEENSYDPYIYGRLRFARDAKIKIADCNHPLALQAVVDINDFVKIGTGVRDSTNDTLKSLANENIAKAREEERAFTAGNIFNAFGKLLVDSAQTSRANGEAKRHGKSIKALMDARL